MSYIVREGNLAAAPELREGAKSGTKYTYARVIVTDRIRTAEGEFVDGALVGDRAQLPAVGRGGVLEMAAQIRGRTYDMTELHLSLIHI